MSTFGGKPDTIQEKADIKKVDIDCLCTGPIGCFRATKPLSGWRLQFLPPRSSPVPT